MSRKRYTHVVDYWGGYGPDHNEGREEWRIWAFVSTEDEANLEQIRAQIAGISPEDIRIRELS